MNEYLNLPDKDWHKAGANARIRAFMSSNKHLARRISGDRELWVAFNLLSDRIQTMPDTFDDTMDSKLTRKDLASAARTLACYSGGHQDYRLLPNRTFDEL